MRLVDTHAHIYADEFDADRDEMITRAKAAGVSPVLMPAVDSESHARMLSLEERYPGDCLSMMGLHPCSVKSNYKDELKLIERYISKRSFIAIGETGLDFYWDISYKEQQYESLRQHAQWAVQYDLPIVLHSRNATEECIDVMREYRSANIKGVFHCFSGTLEQAKKIIDLDMYLGIGGVLTFKNSGLDKVMNAIGLDRVVLETDAPYLSPVPFRGKRNEPSYIHHVAKRLAEIKNIDLVEIEEITTQNAKRLFRLGVKF
jgi:TatD DNase family protein